MRKLFLILALLLCAPFIRAQCSTTTYGSYICQTSTEGFQSSVTSHNVTVSVTSGYAVLGYLISQTATVTLGASGSGSCGNIVNTGSTVNATNSAAMIFWTSASSTGTCTLTFTSSTSSTIGWRIWVWSGWSGTYDTIGAVHVIGSTSSGTNVNCPAVTTTANGDLVLGLTLAASEGSGTVTAVSPFSTVQSASGGMGAIENNQSTAGSITPQWSYSISDTLVCATVSLELGTPTAATPTFSLAAGTYNTSLPRSTTVATTTTTAYLCVTTCTTSGCTPATPAATSPGTCSTGTQYNTDSQSLTLPAGYSNYSALATESGYNNSGVVTSGQYDIVPTVSTLMYGQPVGGVFGDLYTLSGNYLNPSTGFIGTFNNLTTPITALTENLLMDGHSGTSGAAPTTTTLSSSTNSSGISVTWSIGDMGGGTTWSNGLSNIDLFRPVNIGGTVYYTPLSGSLWTLCQSENGTVTATWCGAVSAQPSTTPGVISAAYWYNSNCNNTSSVDCGAVGRISLNIYYVTAHFNPGAGSNNCVGNGILLEDSNGNSPYCLPYVNGTTYRINLLKSVAVTPVTATFTNGNASISGTNTFTANQPVQLSTTGTLPSNLSPGQFTATGTPSGNQITGVTAPTGYTISNGLLIGGTDIPPGTTVTNYSGTTVTMSNSATGSPGSETIGFSGSTYYVLSAGLTTSAFELSTQQGGTAIVPSGAGSGTITATVGDQLTVCTAAGALVGSLFAPANTTSETTYVAYEGPVGEGPSVAGYNFYLGGWVINNTGVMSQTTCF